MPAPDLPYRFILDFLSPDRLEVKKMFGHRCLYFDGLMVLFLISKEGNPDNGICLATSAEHISSLKNELKSLRALHSYGEESTGWRLIPADSENFERDTEIACKLIRKKDPRIGREPSSSKRKKTVALKKTSRRIK